MITMGWVPYVVFLMGVLDAGLIMLGGLVLAGMLVAGKEVDRFLERVAPAVLTLIGCSIAAALVLAATRALVAP